jgi:hypothetical protein
MFMQIECEIVQALNYFHIVYVRFKLNYSEK